MNIFTLFFLLSTLSIKVAHAECVKNLYGKVICGEGLCKKDSHGKVLCASMGGDAILDCYREVLCGVGKCEKDNLGKVWCSKQQGGGAERESHGEVKCLGGSMEGYASLYQAAQ